MKRLILSLAVFIALFFTANTAFAKGIIIYNNGEKIEVVKKLPNDVSIDDVHVNLGVMYNQFSIFWVPLWNYGEVKYVLINDKKNTYYDLSAEDIEIIKNDYNIDIPENYTISFWNEIGGKLVFGAAIIIIAFFWIRTKSDKKTEISE